MINFNHHNTNYNHSTFSYDGIQYAYDVFLLLFSAFYKGLTKYPSNTNQYFFYSNHLGSSSWITYTDGSVTQHMQNLPPDSYRDGEPFIDQRATSYDIRYIPIAIGITGKEMDSETGYQFPIAIGIGARYYNSDISVWLSVDPKASHFPHISSYNYVEQNPLKYIDKKGENPIGALVGAVAGFTKEVVGQTISNGIRNLDNDRGFFDDWGKQMDWADVTVSTGEGALAGITSGASLLLTNSTAAVLRSGIDLKADEGFRMVGLKGKHKKKLIDASLDLVGEAVSFGIGRGVRDVEFDAIDGALFMGSFLGSIGGITNYARDEGKVFLRDWLEHRKERVKKCEGGGHADLKDVYIEDNGDVILKSDRIVRIGDLKEVEVK
jgi:RHS repeat-associated protein